MSRAGRDSAYSRAWRMLDFARDDFEGRSILRRVRR